MRIASYRALFLTATTLALGGCGHFSQSPKMDPAVLRPEVVLDFPTLYKANCAACHGENGKNGAAISLNDAVYLAVAGEGNLREVTAKGVHGGLMPGFSKSAGGMLTDKQVDALVQGMVQWGRADVLAGQSAPPYQATLQGDPARGQQAIGVFCARCHGSSAEGLAGDKNGKGKVGSIVDGSYLALITDQGLRSYVIAGKQDEGMPDWRTDGAQALTDQQITDIVAWLASKRGANPGQPYPAQP